MKCNATIKTRVPDEWKQALDAQAKDRFLTLSDIVREAFREYFQRHPQQSKKGEICASEN
jgi:hypothetical protein